VVVNHPANYEPIILGISARAALGPLPDTGALELLCSVSLACTLSFYITLALLRTPCVLVQFFVCGFRQEPHNHLRSTTAHS
jgi:hypothetical protein